MFRRYFLKLTCVAYRIRALLIEALKMEAARFFETSVYAENITQKTLVWLHPAVKFLNFARHHVDLH